MQLTDQRMRQRIVCNLRCGPGQRFAIVGVAALIGLLCYLGPIERAAAYPQFQFSTYATTCTACHFSPTGGGLVNGFGRGEAGDTISQYGGDGGFLHGLWTPPEWIQLGADFRGASIVKKTWDEPQVLGFPMQADLYTRFAFKDFSFNLITGLRGSAREPRRPLVERLWSREHYLMWSPSTSNYYARVGRFFAPYGLRLPDHSAYVRRYLGQHTLEETYNLSFGRMDDAWEAHGTLFMPSPLFPFGRRASGGTFYYERRIRDDSASFGAQSRFDISSDDVQFWLGGLGKLWLDDLKLLFLSELDFGLQTFRLDGTGEDPDPQLQMALYFGVTYFLKQGFMLGGAIEHFDHDVALKGSARDSINLTLQYFPYAHVEVMLLGKLETQGFDSPNPQAMLMFHYYL
ncbi:MAG: hypothetical protein MJE77_21290 [Proteobacteria bacterium]|nr:hypothetical protein [Pseudomonadota bacterium]